MLDGFFDFTPVQGEILRRLIPAVPNVIVNLNGEPRNPEIFRPFQSTIEHLQSITKFKEKLNVDAFAVAGGIASLRAGLFNETPGADLRDDIAKPADSLSAVTLFECADRETEIRSIAKEIKRLIFEEKYELSEIALVVRQRAAYADAIAEAV